MSTDQAPVELDPVIHAQARLRVTATLAALGPGDRLRSRACNSCST